MSYQGWTNYETWEDAFHEWVDGRVDVYNARLLDWVKDDPGADEYIEEAVSNFGGLPDPFDLYKLLQYGQFAQKEAALHATYRELQKLAEQEED